MTNLIVWLTVELFLILIATMVLGTLVGKGNPAKGWKWVRAVLRFIWRGVRWVLIHLFKLIEDICRGIRTRL